MVNATGWNELIDGHLIGAVFTMFDSSNAASAVVSGGLAGWTVAILFIVYQFVLYLKTQNLALCWMTGMLFVSLYITSVFIKTASVHIIFVILVFELCGILYFWLFK